MINVYSANTTDFNNNGLAVLDNCIKAEVTEELNGTYELDLEYPYANNTKWQYLVEDNIIKCPTPRGEQLFRIKYTTKTFNSIEIYALHIFYDLMDNFIESLSLNNISGASALELIGTNTQYSQEFTFSSDIANTGTSVLTRINPVQAIMGSYSNSFLNIWGGEILRDNYTVTIDGAIGQNRGFTIQYGKNMTGIQDKSDYSNIATRIMPVGKDESGNDLLLPEKYIDSPIINNYPHPKIESYDYNDIKVNSNADNGNIVTTDDVYTQLRAKVDSLYNDSNLDKPILDLTVDFVELSKTDEYKDLSILQQLYLGDAVIVKHTNIGIDLTAKVTKYVYDAILEKYTSIDLGGTTANGTTSISLATQNNDIKLSIDDVASITDKIKIAMGGYVVKRENEILIMDTPSITTATKVWRWNINGLGYSSTGYSGTYGIAITMNGEIVADFIKTGELDASLLKAGVISSVDGTFKLSIDDGKFTTYATDTGYKALELQNRTIKGYDFINANQQIWQIETERYLDAQGNATGTPLCAISVTDGSGLVIEKMSANGSVPVLTFYNNVNGQTYIQCNCDVNIPSTGNKNVWSGNVTVEGVKFNFQNGMMIGFGDIN